MLKDFSALKETVRQCSYRDRWILGGKLQRLEKNNKVNDFEKKLNQLSQQIEKAVDTQKERAQKSFNINYPSQLPVAQKINDIVEAISNNQVVIVAGETGSGKTTQLPKACLQAGLGRKGLIGHTQPRRLAARAVSNRIAEELNSRVGELVGYQVRFKDQVSDQTFIKVMTDGILLNEIKFDKYLNQYEAIIIDEAHERSLNIDFLLGYLKKILRKRPELKLIITSATIDVERFSKFFSGAPVFSVSGRSYPVEINYRPPVSSSEYELSLSEQIAECIEEIQAEEKARSWRMGDVLVFLPGEREIREIAKALRDYEWRDTEVLPLYARLSEKDQNRIFQSHSGRRIVLSTNVAETSLTVPGIRYVIDPGTVRISRYSYRSKLQRLPIEAVSQASANQRSGRCGRVAEGICYRLYDEADYESRPEFTDPEILRTNLSAVILKMLDTGIGNVYDFEFLNAPENKLWNDGFKLLFELEAVDNQKKLTKLGKKIASIPADPKLGKMLITAGELNCLKEVLLIVSGLSIQDPRERPAEKQQAADQCHAEYKDPDSDFIGFLNLWNRYETQRQELSNNQIKKFCQKHFLSYMRMREWREVHRQLHLYVKDLGLVENTDEASYESIHRALLSGLLGNIGRHEERREYVGCRNRKFMLSPGSGLNKKKPKWIFSAELVETAQVYARNNAKIEPEWVESLAGHVVKKNWSEPHWQSKRAQVVAKEKVTLYGLELINNRTVNFGNIDQTVSREIFIRSGLIEDQYKTKDSAIKHNRKLIKDLEAIEDRTRRKDVVVDDEIIYSLYDAVVPAHVVSGASFEKWRKRAGADLKGICFSENDLKRGQAEDFDPNQYPDFLENNGIKFPLSYQFNPGERSDGVNISVPISAIKQISAEKLEKGIPGLLREKCIQLIKNLPRTLRKNFVPVPDVVDKLLPKLESSDDPLLENLSRELKYLSGVSIPLDAWKLELLEDYLRLNVRVVDEKGRLIEQGRDLISVAEKLKDRVEQVQKPLGSQTEKKVTGTDWVFGKILQREEIKQAGIVIGHYPALSDKKECVEKVYSLDLNHAKKISKNAIARLLKFRLESIIGLFPKHINDYQKLGLLYAPVGQSKFLYDDLIIATIKHCFLLDDIPQCADEFEKLYEERRSDYLESAQRFCSLVYQILSAFHDIKKKMKGKVNLALAIPMNDLQSQLDQLVYDGFLSSTPYKRLSEFPRYLKACVVRYEKMARDMGNERRYVPVLAEWSKQYHDRLKQHELQGIVDDNLEQFRWMIEEQRVSWYAQQLGTAETVSEKRLNKYWETVSR